VEDGLTGGWESADEIEAEEGVADVVGVAPAAGRLGPIASAPIPVTAVRRNSLRAFFWAQGRRSEKFFVKAGNLFMGVLQNPNELPTRLS
jgi:hypothetical protein